MSGAVTTYVPAVLAVSFQHGDDDYIECSLRWAGYTCVETPFDGERQREPPTRVHANASIECFMSSVFCPFTDLMAWLESVVSGVQECAFQWDAEGPEGELRWHRRDGDTGFLSVTWSPVQSVRSVLLERRQMVTAIYEAYRSFVGSPQYKPQRYERPSRFGAHLRQLRSIPVEQWLVQFAV